MSTVPDFSWLPSTRERFEHMLNVLPPALPADDLAGVRDPMPPAYMARINERDGSA